MKKLLLFVFPVLTGLMGACEPIVDEREMAAKLSESELILNIKQPVEGGNLVVVENNTPGVNGVWDFGLKTSTRSRDTVTYPYVGDIAIKFLAIGDGIILPVTRTVKVTEITHPVDPAWALFAGDGSKTWVWADEACYGANGYGNDKVPAWEPDIFNPGDVVMEGKTVNADEEIVFDINGGANFIRRKSDGTVIEKGTFAFDMKHRNPGDPNAANDLNDEKPPFIIGKLTLTGATLPCGSTTWSTAPVYTYEILILNDDELVFEVDNAGNSPWALWASGTCWRFKAKE
ncbi:MAG: hypothetical protein LBV41_07165 [Cytophagaceae bacterium]|jgi:hypothetical protein|nr:hypothetical protein [Cytophagaceae bacterium]